MSIKQLKKYLEHIHEQNPINLLKFSKLISSLLLDHDFLPTDISAKKIKGNLYLVTDIHTNLISQLELLANDYGNDRISASRQNRSHNTKVDGSFLIIRQSSAHPEVILFDEKGRYSLNRKITKKALIIENRQNFLCIEKTLSFLKQKTNIEITEGIDVIFSEGNSICNSLHYRFLSQYQKLYIFVDLDLGGIIIARNLNKLLPNISKEFLVPADIEIRLSNVIEKTLPQEIDEIIKLGASDSFIAPYAKLIQRYNRTLEQESYLHDTKN